MHIRKQLRRERALARFYWNEAKKSDADYIVRKCAELAALDTLFVGQHSVPLIICKENTSA